MLSGSDRAGREGPAGKEIMKRIVFAGLLCGLAAAAAAVGIPDEECILFDTSYGRRLPGSTDDVTLWWASSGWKVARTRPAPRKSDKAVRISCAGNEWDAAQLVVSPSTALSGFLATAGNLVGPDGAAIAAENVEVLRVRYVNVQQPTDRSGAVAPWPDPLPPFKGPIDIAANENQPLWIRVYVPRGTPPGRYKGRIRLTAEGYEAQAPLVVEVYDFELPDRMTCTTAFGFGAGTAFSYQKVSDPEQQRQVLEMYWESFANHHISPYSPTPLVSLPVEWVKLGENEGGDLPEADRRLLQEHALTPRFDWAAWDAEMARVFSTYHFNSFRLGIPNVGGGQLQGFAPDTREHELAFTNYCVTMQEHLREKGWLDYAYVYWTDEPRKSDYPHVKQGFLKLKKAAPDITRMITEHVVPGLVGGPDLWCPDSWWYDHEKAEERRQHGDRFWWYVCTVPKAPFPGLFTDHPGTDLRAWLWQTWKYDIEGILVWTSNLWTTGKAYPDTRQNPYEDAMSWNSNPDVSIGQPKAWGNGDGRFIYPPEAAATGYQPETVLDGPVDSIRWEMLRDGIEDYEYFVILEQLLEDQKDDISPRRHKRLQALLSVPDEITSGLKQYTKDPAPIEERRERLARAIEQLTTE
jgi:Glycoside hydrolase 123, catalytic domain/Glycoside hydrolase 123 N-terminal domain